MLVVQMRRGGIDSFGLLLFCRFCERCGHTAEPEWRYILSVILEDHTHNTWATAFAEAGQPCGGQQASDSAVLLPVQLRIGLQWTFTHLG